MKRVRFIIAAGGVAATCLCHGGVAAQVDSQRNVEVTSTNIVWQAVKGGICVTGGSAWKNTGNGVANVVGAEAEPMMFEGENVSNATVKTVVMVVRTKNMGEGGLRMRETLICGESIFRLGGRPMNQVDGNAIGKIERGGFCEVASWQVDAVPSAPLVAGKAQLVEVTFKNAMPLSEVFLGSDGGREEWRRAWGGAFCEAVFFDAEPSHDTLDGVRSLFNRKWDLGLNVPRITQASLNAARAEGVDFSHYYGTVFMVK